MHKRRMLAALLVICLLSLCAPVSGALASSKYYITVDLTNQIVTVYDSEDTSEINIVRQMICSTGRNATPTPQGTWYLPSRSSTERTEWYYFPKFKCYAKWATRITGGILFHSTLFTAAKKGPTSASTRALGSQASHGCVRLRVNDAKFIAENCPAGTKCRIYKSGKRNSSLRNKLKKKTFIRDKQTYDSFLGRKPAESLLPLSKGSTGTLVTLLQTRLQQLGFYGDAVNAAMGKSTVAAVKAFQAASGIRATGSVDQALWDVIFADGAVTGTLVTLSEGSSGPAVAVLQSNLITLLMLQGAADGNYTAQTAEAVRLFQSAYGYTATGSADGDLQNDIAARAAQVRQTFGASPYAMTVVNAEVKMAKVKAKSGAKLSKTASKKGKSLKKLKKATAVRVVSEGKSWTKVRYGDLTGYVKKSALTFYTETVAENGYVQAEAATQTTSAGDSTAATEPVATTEASVSMEAEALTAEDVEVGELAGLDDGMIYGTEPVEDDATAAEGDGEDEASDNGLEVDSEPASDPQAENEAGDEAGDESGAGADDEAANEPAIIPVGEPVEEPVETQADENGLEASEE